ncbi:hypothetical protein FA048_06235 [Pedobacter polaris]|uniref:Tail specific protease domain-containing protein n=1 Tax=Pedobacter polaris TaxID=2571273 RepID=A0A4U1CVE0_9SPHI|nr:hypothetical protein [Pedobacter polaris]TKC13201.1 hypothetical protein FA048_06235 [Pedobacter polaris]
MKIKSLLFSLFIFTGSSLIKAQDCNCITALDEVATGVKKSPSYKDGIKERGKEYFSAELIKIKAEIAVDPLIKKNCSAYIQKYLSLFKDKHLSLYIDYSKIKSQKDVFESELYKQTQQIKIDSNNLKFTDDLEGIYIDVYRYYKVALIKDANKVNQYVGIILSSKSGLWKSGQVKFVLKKNEDNTYDGFFYDDIHFAKYTNITYADQKLVGVEWVKEERMKLEPINPFIVPTKKKWDYKKLDDETDYVYLGTFSGMLAYESDTFYKELIPKLKGKKLIVDVRNNTGGGERSYNMFLNFVNSAACAANQVAIIQNLSCASGGEHFILAMRKNPKVKTYGENSAGYMGYGYGNRSSITVKTSCFNYISEITENKYPAFKIYETVGIPPDVKLLRDKDWIKQVIAYLDINK